MNELYVSQVLKAHKLCQELNELEKTVGLTDEYYKSVNDYIDFAMECDTGDYHITLFLVKLAFSYYNIGANATRSTSFGKFYDTYKTAINNIKDSKDRNYSMTLLPAELRYLQDIKPEKN